MSRSGKTAAPAHCRRFPVLSPIRVIAGERLSRFRAHLDLTSGAKGEAAKPVPFGLENCQPGSAGRSSTRRASIGGRSRGGENPFGPVPFPVICWRRVARCVMANSPTDQVLKQLRELQKARAQKCQYRNYHTAPCRQDESQGDQSAPTFSSKLVSVNPKSNSVTTASSWPANMPPIIEKLMDCKQLLISQYTQCLKPGSRRSGSPSLWRCGSSESGRAAHHR
jgi:hypothetical protein